MNTYVGDSSGLFGVAVQTVADSSFFHITSPNNIIAARTGINSKKPSWSYLFYQFGDFKNQSYAFISYLSKGSDLPNDYVDNINTFIASN
jgi:hypothetical protein